MKRPAFLGLLLASIAGSAMAAGDYQISGFADLRLGNLPSERSWLEGGLDKLRYQGSGGTQATLEQMSLIGDALLTPALTAYAHLRYAPGQASLVDLVESFLRYRPVSTTPWRWSIKAGAFFPPISLENDGIGWSTYWTLTPSAINSWIGEELRTIGGEASLEWRGEENRLQALFSLFAANDPAGVLLADRGWGFNDLPTGIFDRTRLPDPIAVAQRRAAPIYAHEFAEIDGKVGWYGGLSWSTPIGGSISLLRYDNNADPAAFAQQFAWHTSFWSLGWHGEIADFTLLAQAMIGETIVAPRGDADRTSFWAGYFLIGRELGDWGGAWRAAARLDLFATGFGDGTSSLGEHGSAVTAAMVWRPRDWLRLTGELMQIDSRRQQRVLLGLAPAAHDTRATLAVKLIY